MSKGLFIVLDGMDCTGKTTLIQKMHEWLNANGIASIRTREPGGSPVAEKIRELVLFEEDLSPMTQMILMNAARRIHVEKVIQPHLNAGFVVLCDRYVDSTAAYQGTDIHGTELAYFLDSKLIGLFPDLHMILTASQETLDERYRKRTESNNPFDERSQERRRRALEHYNHRASTHKARYRLVNAEPSEEEVFASVLPILEAIKDYMRKQGTGVVFKAPVIYTLPEKE